MTTYRTIKAQIAKLERQAADLLKKVAASVAKYQNPLSGKIWTGHGKAPGWLADALKKGKTKDAFLIGIRVPRTRSACTP
jgi:DNA-binding protein H-NS